MPAGSAIPALFERLSWSVPAEPSDGVPDPSLAVTVHVDPDPETLLIDGVPVSPLWTSEKFPLATPATASLKLTVQETELALVGDGPARTIPVAVGGVVSIVQVYDVAELEVLPDTALIAKVCDPGESELKVTDPLFVPEQVLAMLSSVHVNVTPDCESL